MNFRQFEALYWVARLGSFRAAALHLKTSQPAISSRIRELEKDLDIELFDRASHKARLTSKGHELHHYASQLMQLSAEIRQKMGAPNVLAGRVRLGIASIPAMTWLATMMRRVESEYPGITVEFVVASSAELFTQLSTRALDIAVLSSPMSGMDIRGQVLGRVRLAWIVSPNLDLPTGPLSASELALRPVISDTVGSQLHTLSLEWFRAEGVEPSCHHAASNMSTRIQLAVEGLGVALIPAFAASRELAAGTLHIVATSRPLPALEYLIVHGDIDLTPAGAAVADLVKELISVSLTKL